MEYALAPKQLAPTSAFPHNCGTFLQSFLLKHQTIMDRYSHLLIEAGQSKGTSFTIPPDGAQMGRSNRNDLCIEDEGLSRNQCRFEFRDGRLWVVDLKSANSTRVNQAPIKEAQLKKGDRILVGDTQILVLMTTVKPRLKVNNRAASKAPPKLVLDHPTGAARVAVMPIWILVLGWLAFLAYSVLRDDAGQADSDMGSDDIVATSLPDSTAPRETEPSEPAPPTETYSDTGTAPEASTPIVASTSRSDAPLESTPATPPDSGNTDALKRSIVFKVMKQEYEPAQEALLDALTQSSTPEDRWAINEISAYVRAMTLLDEKVATAISEKLGETITLTRAGKGIPIRLVALTGEHIKGVFTTKSGDKSVSIKVENIPPVDKSKLLGPPESSADNFVQCLLHLQAADYDGAEAFVPKCGVMKATLADMLTTLQ
ncbi:MAG: hypothetical protein ACI9X0_002185 [Kiritimatiellia bacterium]|jgi:hypothetical protein